MVWGKETNFLGWENARFLNGVKTVDVVEKYNPEEGTWREVSPLVFGRSVPGIAVAYLWPVQSTMKSFWEPESQL